MFTKGISDFLSDIESDASKAQDLLKDLENKITELEEENNQLQAKLDENHYCNKCGKLISLKE